jgi:EpsI family protein
LLGAAKLEDIVPRSFGNWTSTDRDDEVAPREEGSLAARLYGQTVGRLYTHAKTGAEVMMLLAYGDAQTNQLQVHRPEVCYPAFGYDILASRPSTLSLAAGVALPVRELTVRRKDRIEQIVYWTRLGDFLPTGVREQRVDRFRNALAGVVPDGLLARFSRAAGSADTSDGEMAAFVSDLIRAVAPARRKALVGSDLARRAAAA